MSSKNHRKQFSTYVRKALLLIAGTISFLHAAAQRQEIDLQPGLYTVEEVFLKVSDTSDWFFAVNSRFDRSRVMSVERQPATIGELLDLVVKDTGYSYEIRDKYIIIKEIPLSPEEVLESPDADAFGPKIYYFVIDKMLLMRHYSTNAGMLDALDRLLTDTEVYPNIDSIVITSAASPIGSRQRNAVLSVGRSEALESYIRWQHPQVDRNRMYSYPVGIDWEGFWSLIENTPNVPSRETILNLKGRWDEDTTLELLRKVGGKQTYNYLLNKIYPKLQYASVRVVLNDGTSIPTIGSPIKKLIEPEVVYDTIRVERIVYDTVRVEAPVPVVIEPAPAKKSFYIALKNNLVDDAALLPNLAVEIPFGRGYRWSAEVEGRWSWWNTEASSYWYHRIQMAGVELRWWFGNRTGDPMHGWYIGAYGFGGTYDVRLFTKTNQDLGELSNLSYSAGLSIGYAMPVGRRLNMEFGLGFGYMGGEYKKYYRSSCIDCFPWVSTHERNWIGPTKAKVSLVWQIGSGINGNYKKGR